MASEAQLRVIEAARDLVAVVFTGKEVVPGALDAAKTAAYSGLVAALRVLDETSAADARAQMQVDGTAGCVTPEYMKDSGGRRPVTLPRVWLTYQGSVVQAAYAKRENAIRSLEGVAVGNTGIAPVEVVDVSEVIAAAMTSPVCPECGEPYAKVAGTDGFRPIHHGWCGIIQRSIEREEAAKKPVPMRLHCPSCHALHVDAGEFATKVHHTHACQACGMTWRPAVVPTVGVAFLPGFKDAIAVVGVGEPEEEDPWTEVILKKALGQTNRGEPALMPILMGVVGPTASWEPKHAARVKAIMVRAGWTEVKCIGWTAWKPPPVKEAGAPDVKGAP